MQNTKLLSAPALPHTIENFPTLLLSIRGGNVIAGDGVSSAGSMTDPITGGVYVPSILSHYLVGGGADDAAFGFATDSTTCNLESGSMPTIGDKHPLLIVVREANNAGNYKVAVGDPAAATGLTIMAASAGIIGVSGANKVTLGAITFGSAVTTAIGTLLDREQATDSAAAQMIAAIAASTKTVAANTDVGTATDLLEATFGPFLGGMLIEGLVSNCQIYGIYLLGFNTARVLKSAWLTPALQWMARNPYKGLYPLFAGLT